MKSRLAVFPLLCVAVLAAGCGAEASKSESTPAPQSAPLAKTGEAAPAAAEFGVPECDRYVKKYLACLDSKVPESARAMMLQSFEQTKVQWKQAASTEQGRASLATVCAQAELGSKQAMSAYGCAW